MKKILLVNWKAYLSVDKALSWCATYAAALGKSKVDVELVLAVPSLLVERVAVQARELSGISLAAQGISPYPQGSYTGSVPAAWLRGLVKYALIGHRERRYYFHETVQDVARQGYEALAEELQPIVCVEQQQLIPQAAAFALEELEQLFWAWTPETTKIPRGKKDLAAIESGLAAVVEKIEHRPVLYGGGVTKENALDLWQLPGVSGLLLARGGLEPESCAQLVKTLEL